MAGSATASTKAPKQKDSTKVSFRFGGRADVVFMYDSYKSVDRGNGLQYNYPLAPEYNSAGGDVNFQNRLRFNIASSRINFTVGVPELLNARGTAFVEADFMGSTESVLSVLRLRHAYFRLDWKKRYMLLGQTSHLTMPESMSPNTVLFGCGTPFNPLNRPVQAQYGQKIGRMVNFDVALALFGGAQGERQSYAMLPDMHARFTFGDPNSLLFGVVGGVKWVKPRTLTADSSIAKQKVVSFDAAVFMRYSFGSGHALRLFGIWGQDLSPLAIMGGYAPLESQVTTTEDYGYATISAYSLWLDYETKIFEGFQAGVFCGFQKNLGAKEMVDMNRATVTSRGIDMAYRIAPRLWYHYRGLSFGLEYTYTTAVWAANMNRYYQMTEAHSPTFDNRITLLARYKF